MHHRKGTNCVLVIYHYDDNAILLHPLRNGEADMVSNAWLEAQVRIKSNNKTSKHYTGNNTKSNILLQTMQDNKVILESVPLHMHCRNATKKAIRTFKNRFLAGMATCHPDFQLSE